LVRWRLVADGAGRAGEVEKVVVGIVVEVALGARDVDDDARFAGVFLFVDSGEGAEEEAVDVGEDGGAARGDAALLEDEGEVPEVGVDVGGRFILREILAEESGEVGGVVAEGGQMARAESGVPQDEAATLAAGGGAVLAPFLRHGKPILGRGRPILGRGTALLGFGGAFV
jgi:hypothetical protein